MKNFSNFNIPDVTYAYLALDSNFVPEKKQSQHDYVYDTKEFCRKLAWAVYHKNKTEKKISDETQGEKTEHRCFGTKFKSKSRHLENTRKVENKIAQLPGN